MLQWNVVHISLLDHVLEAYRRIGTEGISKFVRLLCFSIRDIVNLIIEVRIVEVHFIWIDAQNGTLYRQCQIPMVSK